MHKIVTTPASVRLSFGHTGLDLDVPDGVDVLAPWPVAALTDPQGAIRRALLAPTHGVGLPSLAPRGAIVAVSICDVTRPFPSRTVLPVLLDELPGRRVRLLIATGSHRACTPSELEAMLGSDVIGACELFQHDADSEAEHVTLGSVPGSNVPARIDRRFVEADVRVTLGFVEPHFFAGFSGGPKMVAPGLAQLETIAELHSAKRIGDPRAIWGVLEGNPVHDPIRALAARASVAFGLDVALDRDHQIVAIFSGELEHEHRSACAHVKATAMVRVAQPYDVVVTTNSGYPLDQNLYQCIKGLRAAAGIVREGGLIILAAACEDGLPAHGGYADLLATSTGPAEFLRHLSQGEVHERDQWQVQVQAQVQSKARVLAFTPGITVDDLRRAWLEPSDDVASALKEGLARAGRGARAAILPDGPQTIAYVV